MRTLSALLFLSVLLASCDNNASARNAEWDAHEAAQRNHNQENVGQANQEQIAAASPESSAPTLPVTWSSSTTFNRIGDIKTVYLSTEATNEIVLSQSRRFRPTLHVRCLENTTSVFVKIEGLFINSQFTNVTIMYDSRTATTSLWQPSAENDSLGRWLGIVAIPIATALLNTDTFIMRFTPYGENAVTIEFDMNGYAELLPELRETCHW